LDAFYVADRLDEAALARLNGGIESGIGLVRRYIGEGREDELLDALWRAAGSLDG
jgi:hypothetical protein